MGWQWKSLRHPPKDQAALFFPKLPPLSCMARAMKPKLPTSFPCSIPPSCPFRTQGNCEHREQLEMKVSSATHHPDTGYNWCFSTIVVWRLGWSKTMGWIYGFSKEKSKHRVQQPSGGRTSHHRWVSQDVIPKERGWEIAWGNGTLNACARLPTLPKPVLD